MSLERFNSPDKTQRTGGDSIYGSGSDGNVVIISNTVLSRDLYCENLTLGNISSNSSPITVDTNGFRIFVKNNLTLFDGVTVSCAASASDGTVARGRLSGFGDVEYSLGGNSDGVYSATSLSDSQKSDFISLISGVIADTDGAFHPIQGGASGLDGPNGTLTPATPGGAGSLNRNPLVAGGPGTPGTNVPVSLGGAGTSGGGIVVIVAKNIVAGNPSAENHGVITAIPTPIQAQVGQTSSIGSNGSAAPNATLTHLTDSSASYIIGDGVHGGTGHVPAPLLPHGGHVPSLLGSLHGHVYRHVHQGADHAEHRTAFGQHFTGNFGYHGGRGNFAHTYNTYSGTPPDSSYFHINGIPHTSPHRAHSGVAYSSDFAHHGNGNATFGGGTHGAHYGSTHDYPVGRHTHTPSHHYAGDKNNPAVFIAAFNSVFHYPRNHQDINHSHYRQRSAGTVSSQGSNVYPGGSAGAAGFSTAGTNGVAGGGGGVVIVTSYIEEVGGLPILSSGVNIDVSGGLNGLSIPAGEDGTVIIIMNN